MAIRSIRRQATVPGSYYGTANACPIYVDSDDNKLKFIPGGNGSTTEVEILDGATSPLTTKNIGAKAGSTVTAVEYGNAFFHQTVLTLTALPLTLADATVGAGVKIYDFPLGVVTIIGAVGTVAETTTSTLASTLNTGVTINWGVGSTTQTSATLATTEQDILTVSNLTASATINVAGAAGTKVRTAAPASLDGTATAIDAFFNVAVATATDIDGDATTTYTGQVTINWIWAGVL